jgi:hypothetical protein
MNYFYVGSWAGIKLLAAVAGAEGAVFVAHYLCLTKSWLVGDALDQIFLPIPDQPFASTPDVDVADVVTPLALYLETPAGSIDPCGQVGITVLMCPGVAVCASLKRACLDCPLW